MRPLSLSLFLAVLLLGAPLGLGRVARAEERVPLVPPDKLPIAGTCAPIAEGRTVHVLLGNSEALGWYRVAGVARELDQAALEALLLERAGLVPEGGRSETSVWITASADHAFGQVARVLVACQLAGIYRVGLRVRSDAAPGVFGFPMYLPLPAPRDAASVGKASLLNVRLQTVAASEPGAGAPRDRSGPPVEVEGRSNPALVYTAAKRAVARHGAIVASARIAGNANVQDAVTLLDMLYRGGCVGVRLPLRMLSASARIEVMPVVWIESTQLGDVDNPEPPPLVPPRTEPWPIDGANQRDWMRLELVPLPSADAGADEGGTTSYLAAGRMPAFDRERAAAGLATWADDLSAALASALRGGPGLVPHLSEAIDDPQRAAAWLERLRREADGLQPGLLSTLRVDARLWQGEQPVGAFEALLLVAGAEAQVVEARWLGSEQGRAENIGDRGIALSLRHLLEGAVLGLREQGAAGVVWAPREEVLRAFPKAAAPGLENLLRTRERHAAVLVSALQQSTFDRLTVRVGQAGATLLAGEEVGGLLYIDLALEDGNPKVVNATVRRAP